MMVHGRRAKFSLLSAALRCRVRPKQSTAHTSKAASAACDTGNAQRSTLQVLLLHFRPWLQSFLSQQVRPMVPQATVLVTENVAAALFLSKFLPLAVFVTWRGLNLAAHTREEQGHRCAQKGVNNCKD